MTRAAKTRRKIYARGQCRNKIVMGPPPAPKETAINPAHNAKGSSLKALGSEQKLQTGKP